MKEEKYMHILYQSDKLILNGLDLNVILIWESLVLVSQELRNESHWTTESEKSD